jgi:hypothetical protein
MGRRGAEVQRLSGSGRNPFHKSKSIYRTEEDQKQKKFAGENGKIGRRPGGLHPSSVIPFIFLTLFLRFI